MRMSDYLKDKIIIIFLDVIGFIFVILLLLVLKISNEGIIAIYFVLGLNFVLVLLYDYFRKKDFYDKLICNLDLLEEKYLITELIKRGDFLEGRIFYDSLYEINKSFNEEIGKLKYNQEAFKDYIEMWIHEVKIPLANLILITHNNKSLVDQRFLEQLKRLEDYLDQVLYYVRSENAEKDYLIKEVRLSSCIKQVALKNKDSLLYNKVILKTKVTGEVVLTDSKWLEFVLNQLISNSIKYRNLNVDSYIEISAVKYSDKVILSIYDNGIGITKRDIPRVFYKTFTGSNGRENVNSTGMGLYISKKLIEKLGHKISIESVLGEYTKVNIIFSNHDYYDVLK